MTRTRTLLDAFQRAERARDLMLAKADADHEAAVRKAVAGYAAEVVRLVEAEAPDPGVLAALGREFIEGMADSAAPSPVTDAVLGASAVAAVGACWTGAHAAGCACIDCNTPF